MLQKSGTFIKYQDKIIGQGREAVRMFLKDNHKISKDIMDAIWKSFKAGQMKDKVVGKEEIS
ncbi:hypothetical protein A2W14_02335 [Candidatus Gottesmanbacteria bacterium RBG_16_37_8]|uniref:RecA-like C-terminal domain-containing protein n=1 Tax=Candidatus Gottesmanbacteria bacterium RBG_16_37_8 TaxID=1798371 RepID=A0A1F5YS76_9BACT|nr:MAG: hypothetical protein A2W14_02335 [Candidatus Gottesmanbacteria bacterium RBG_16_37_8]